jgi:membrane protein DedA with SNARE-associated domain
MTLAEFSALAPYAAVFAATVLEGEVVFVGATVLVHVGRLDAAGVFLAAALGGSVGDQIYFYALRGRFRRWLEGFPVWTRRRDRILGRVRRNASAMILACRFLPGLRVAIPAACAFAQVSPLRFSVLSLLSSLGWAAAVMTFVIWIGPASFAELGIRGWWTPLVPAAFVVAFTWWLSRESETIRPDGDPKLAARRSDQSSSAR